MSRAKTSTSSSVRGFSRRSTTTQPISSSSVRRQQQQQVLLKPVHHVVPDELIDLSYLSPEEQEQIMVVLEKDAELRRLEQERVV